MIPIIGQLLCRFRLRHKWKRTTLDSKVCKTCGVKMAVKRRVKK